MTAPRLAVIVPTVWRPSLKTTLQSIDAAGRTADDLVVVTADGGKEYPGAVWVRGWVYDTRAWFGSCPEPQHNDYGGWARNRSLDFLSDRDPIKPEQRPDWIAYLDDDDVYLPGALDAVRATLADRDPTLPELHVFRVDMRGDPRVTTGPDGCLWTDRELRQGNVSSCMLVHSLAPLADTGVQWRTDVYEHDYHFAADLVAAGYAVHWHENVIALVRPHQGAAA